MTQPLNVGAQTAEKTSKQLRVEFTMYVLSKWIVALLVLCAMSVANAQNVHGILRVVKGDVQIKSAKTGQKGRARIGEKVFPKDVIFTGKDARAKIVMVDNNEINVSPDSQIEIQHYEYNPAEGKKDVLLNVIYGKVRSKVEQKYDGKTTKFQIKTPSAVAGVRGTDFITGYNPANRSSQVITFEGKVDFGLPGPGGTIRDPVSVTPGNQASNTGGAAPGAPAPVPKEELAKMDNESKADTPKSDANGERQPAAKEEKKEEKQDAKDAKQEAREEKKEEKKDAKQDAKEAKQEAREDKKEEKKDAKQDSKQGGEKSGSKSGGSAAGGTAGGAGGTGDGGGDVKVAEGGEKLENKISVPASDSSGNGREPSSTNPGPPSTLPPPPETNGGCNGGAACAPPIPRPNFQSPIPTMMPGMPVEACDAICRSQQLKTNTKLLIRVNN